MDNLAHALVGAALMRAVADRHVPRAASIGVVAANAPDWSELFIGLPGTRADFLVLHRGITHSLVGALVEVVGLTLLIGVGWRVVRWRLSRHGRAVAVPAWGWLAAGIGAAVLSHLYMDWQGSYGWRPFLPWSGTWYYLDWVAIADPFFWLVPLVALAWGAERHWAPLAAALAVGGTITVILVRARDVAATWVLVIYAVVCVVAVVGWIRYWFGPVGRQRVAALALLVLVVYAGAQAVVAGGRKREIRQRSTRASTPLPAMTGRYRVTCARRPSPAHWGRPPTVMLSVNSPASWRPTWTRAARRSTSGMRATRARAATDGRW